jgi:hypothetical protein
MITRKDKNENMRHVKRNLDIKKWLPPPPPPPPALSYNCVCVEGLAGKQNNFHQIIVFHVGVFLSELHECGKLFVG